MTAPSTPLPRKEPTALRAALYGRASSDPKKRGRSIKDQFAVGELDCLDRGWNIHDRYEDRDLSASRRARKARPDYERMVADAEARIIDVIVYAERSRANRTMENSLKLRDLCERTGVLLCYDGRVFDMNRASDRKEFTRDALASEEEAETIINRAERTARLNAGRGAPHGKVPFGYARKYDEDDGHLIGQVPHPVHADAVRELFRRAAARESLSTLTETYRKYVPDASRYTLRYLLKNRSYLGQRIHKGVVTTRADGTNEATWPPIISEKVFLEVAAILDDPSRRTQKDVRAKHLQAGIALCAICIETEVRRPIVTVKAHHPTSKQPVYRCAAPAAHVQIGEVLLDAFVEEALLDWLASPEAAAVFTTPQDETELDRQRDRLTVLRLQLAEARQAAGEIDPQTGSPRLSVLSLASLEAALLPQIAAVEAKVEALTVVTDPVLRRLLTPSTEGVDADWEALEIEQKRHVLRHTVNVTLHPARSRGVRHIDDERVRLVFASEPGFRPPSGRRFQGM